MTPTPSRCARPATGSSLTWREYDERVRRIAAGLHALGVRRGHTVGLMLTNRPEFALVDAAAMHLGAVPFSVYNTSSPEQVAYLFSNAGNRVVVCEDATFDVVAAAGADLDQVVCVDADRPGALTLAALEQTSEDGFDFEAAWRAVEPDDLLTLIYTSGTTGPPKGVQTTHRHVVEQVRAITGVVGVHARRPDHVVPALGAHRGPGHHAVPRGAARGAGHLRGGRPDDRRRARRHAPDHLVRGAAGLGEAQGRAAGQGPRARPRDRSGSRCVSSCGPRSGWTSAAGRGPAPRRSRRRPWTSSPASACRSCELWGHVGGHRRRHPQPAGPGPGRHRRAAAARAGDRASSTTASCWCGRRTSPPATATTRCGPPRRSTRTAGCTPVTSPRIDDDGYVTIVDRKKEIIISAGGKNMSPANIESTLKVGCPLAAAITVVGDGRPFNVALVALDADAAAAYATAHGLSADPRSWRRTPACGRPSRPGSRPATRGSRGSSRSRSSRSCPTFWEPGGDELTPTLKLRRRPIEAKYADVIDRLYGHAG